MVTGHAALSTGAPGAALLYVVLTLAAWPSQPERPLPPVLLGRTWIFVWVSGAVVALLPAQWGANGLSGQAAMGEMMSPTWAITATHSLATWLAGLAPWIAAAISAGLTLAFLAIASAGRRERTFGLGALMAGIMLALAFWMFGQGFGGLSTGTATDVGTGPLLVLLALAVHASRRTETPVEPKISEQRV